MAGVQQKVISYGFMITFCFKIHFILTPLPSSVVLVRSLHFSYGLVTVHSIIVIVLVSELNHFFSSLKGFWY